jgi:hypothetical protein
VGRVLGDAGQDVGQPGLRIHVIHLCRSNNTEHGSRPLSAAIRRGVIVPGVWRKKSRSPIRFIHWSGKHLFSAAGTSMAASNMSSCGGKTERHSFSPPG